MRRAVAAIAEGPAAPGAGEGPLARVGPEVGVEDVFVGEEAVAVRAVVHVLAGVHVQVATDVVPGGVGLATDL